MKNLVEWFLRQLTYVKKLEQAAFHDDLTGLLRRGRFFELFGDLLEKESDVGIVYLDLNGFKSVNDRLGHAIGDKLLKAFASHVGIFFREKNGIIGRMGGDEFAVALPRVKEKYLNEVCVHFSKFLSQRPFVYKNERILLDVSCGIATTQRDGRDPDALLSVADNHMFTQKRRIRHNLRRK